MSPPSIRTGFEPDAASGGARARLPDNQTGLDCGTGQPRRRVILSALQDGRITLCYSVIRVTQTSTLHNNILTANPV